MQASYLAEKEQRNWSDMPAGGGQLGSGQCIGGIVSSYLHLHWLGTPKASSALELKELSSFHKRPDRELALRN